MQRHAVGYRDHPRCPVDAHGDGGHSAQRPLASGATQQIVALRPMDELPHQRLAGLYLTPDIHDATAAIEQLKILHRVDIKDDRYPKRISRLYRDAGDFSDAEQFALRAIYIDPYDLDAHQLLAEVTEKSADEPAVAREQRVIPILQ